MVYLNSTPRKVRTTPAAVPSVALTDQILESLNQVKCTLACASVALGKAQDEEDEELAAQSWAVIHTCVGELGRIEDEFDSWRVSHEHSPEVAHV